MRPAIIAALLAVVLLSVAISYYFHITFVAVFAGLLFALKQIKLSWVFEWLLRFFLIRLPQRIITSAFIRYLIGSKLQGQVLAWLKRQQHFLQQHSKTRLVLYGVVALLVMGASAWVIGVWLLVLYELDVLVRLIWERIWPSLSEYAFVQSLQRFFEMSKRTWVGRQFLKVVSWFQTNVEARVEEAGEEHKENAVKAVEEVLTGILTRSSQLYLVRKETNRFDLRQPSHPRRVGRHEAKSSHGGHRPPPTRPQR